MVHTWPQTPDLFDKVKITPSYVLTVETMVSGFDAIVNTSSDRLSKYAVFIFPGIYLILMAQVADKPVPSRTMRSNTQQKYHFL